MSARRITATAARRQGLRTATFTADELAEFMPADGNEVAFYESIGFARSFNDELFIRTAMRRTEAGIEVMGTWEGDRVPGRSVVSCHPFGQGRKVRVLTK